MTTTFKNSSCQAMTLIDLVFEKVEVVRETAPPMPSQEEVDNLLSYLKRLNNHMTKMIEQMDGPDQELTLAAVVTQANEVMVEVDNMQFAMWLLDPDRPCKSIHGVVRDNPLVHKIYQ
ncbi:hypothetical protein H9Q69_008347 [Fusarium xylarioides]|uniref:Uncharacterized protein n=1 Tax=Fusarium xylarioides TaxID=221167 RepID=A0A9P7HR43_9HYPO|nr:hypothetical protein H9Q70_005365 [Fusarium xylarioides]KAG5762118.1 hypothetical protein H9Q72_009788 [Fusarium xylarioides]KAG5777036.1 hypothetical protein H9Q73_009309 [Fusarium xylarioides]KAG5792601.1 hypothetical protein H9Q69_008347 [Fusarium xylarioides]